MKQKRGKDLCVHYENARLRLTGENFLERIRRTYLGFVMAILNRESYSLARKAKWKGDNKFYRTNLDSVMTKILTLIQFSCKQICHDRISEYHI